MIIFGTLEKVEIGDIELVSVKLPGQDPVECRAKVIRESTLKEYIDYWKDNGFTDEMITEFTERQMRFGLVKFYAAMPD